jgi:hypothetical protein
MFLQEFCCGHKTCLPDVRALGTEFRRPPTEHIKDGSERFLAERGPAQSPREGLVGQRLG